MKTHEKLNPYHWIKKAVQEVMEPVVKGMVKSLCDLFNRNQNALTALNTVFDKHIKDVQSRFGDVFVRINDIDVLIRNLSKKIDQSIEDSRISETEIITNIKDSANDLWDSLNHEIQEILLQLKTLKLESEAHFDRYTMHNATASDARDKITNTLYRLKENLHEKVSKVVELEAVVEKRLNQFRHEFDEQFFHSLNCMINWNKEVAVASLFKGTNIDDNTSKLRREIMKPVLEKKWAQSEALAAEKVNNILKTKGGLLVRLEKELSDLILENERKGMEVTGLKGELTMLQRIIEGDI